MKIVQGLTCLSTPPELVDPRHAGLPAVRLAADRLLATVRASGTAAPMLDEMVSFGQLSEAVGLSDSLEYAAGFDPSRLSASG